ncbi:hemagglutinin/amebocyte aggregation factor-like [Mercenaria mercenaria]|uniref:hemagglutinin/amebocyte aggregation factor-like n=1 Tax=Mercenaria mercenaria TaxID=6596 RepID=UPI00234F36AB|nr:hemagglutinin/amebocyte aggregation factor-like [Mercenaria mercenaria]
MANLEIVRLLVLLAVSLVPTIYACGGWINQWDGPLEFECRSVHQFVSRVQSIHNNHREDRRYKMSCRNIPSYVRHCHSTSCRWTGYLNNYDDLLMYNCGRNGYINGFRSVHNNHYEDRRWRVRCCTVRGLYLHDCTHTGWTNSWDRPQYYNTPYGQITSGVLSWHKNRYEDRRWKYRICKVRKAHCTGEPIEEDFVDIPAIADRSNTAPPAVEEMSVDTSYTDVPAVEESSGDGSSADTPDISISE